VEEQKQETVNNITFVTRRASEDTERLAPKKNDDICPEFRLLSSHNRHKSQSDFTDFEWYLNLKHDYREQRVNNKISQEEKFILFNYYKK
jgi:hypothetical protein